MSTQFYVYTHAMPDFKGVFYVGAGRGVRATNFLNRSAHHKDIVSKYGVKNIVVRTYPCETESSAFELEKSLIKVFRMVGSPLLNKSDGVTTVKGYTRSNETCNKISAYKTGVKRSPFSDEWKRKLGDSVRGKKIHSDAFKSALSDRNRIANAKLSPKQKLAVSIAMNDAQRVKVANMTADEMATRKQVKSEATKNMWAARKAAELAMSPEAIAIAKQNKANAARLSHVTRKLNKLNKE